jgi:hypothetical protein
MTRILDTDRKITLKLMSKKTKSRRISFAWHSACTDIRNAHKYFVRKGKGKKLFGRPKHRWKDSNKINSNEIGDMK